MRDLRQAPAGRTSAAWSFGTLVFSALTLVLLAQACQRTGYDLPCQSHADCPNNAVCFGGQCRQTCNYNRDCQAAERCDNGACMPRAALGDAGHADAARIDVHVQDVNAADIGTPDTGAADTSAADTGAPDTGAPDTTTPDSNTGDAASDDAGIVPVLCVSNTLKHNDIFGDGSVIATYLLDHDFKTLAQVVDHYGESDAVPAGSPTLVHGILNGAVQFAAADALSIDALALPTGLAPRAFSMWLRFDGSTANQSIMIYGGGDGASGPLSLFALQTSGSGELQVDLGDDFISSGFFPLAGRWYHVVLDYAQPDLTWYIDGRVQATQANNFMSTSTTDSFGKVLGAVSGRGDFVGAMDQLRLFNRSLSLAEVTVLAQECVAADPLENITFNNEPVFFEDFSGDLSGWNLWGSPLPRIIAQSGAENGMTFDCNGDANYHSGAESNFSLAHDQDFAVEFRCLQPQDSNASNRWLYVQMGVSHQQATGNGQGAVAMVQVSGISDTNHWTVWNPFGLEFRVYGDNSIYWDHWNDFAYHVYRIEHHFDTASLMSQFRFLIDGQVYEHFRYAETSQDPWYVSIQGRSYGKDNFVDWVKVYTP